MGDPKKPRKKYHRPRIIWQRDLIEEQKELIRDYGLKNKKADYIARNIKIANQVQTFDLYWRKKEFGKFSLRVPGQFNLYNALAAIACALRLKVKPAIIKTVLDDFKGIWRRFEKVGEYSPRRWRGKRASIFSDYAHHPTAIKETLKAAKEFYPRKRLIVVYQPHHFDRTKRLFKEFTESFDRADLVILNEIYDVPGRETIKEVSSRDLVQELKKRKIKAIFTQNLKETKNALLSNIKKGDLVLIMGAGDIYKLYPQSKLS